MDSSTICVLLSICIYCLILYCNGALYGEDCSSSSDCVPDTHQHCDNSSNKCVCDTGYFENDADNGCVSEVILGDSCPSTVLSSVPCSDYNAECTNVDRGYKCLCKSGFYDTDNDTGNVGGTCQAKKSLGKTCLFDAACSDVNAVCNNGICVCNTEYYDDNGPGDNGTCTPKVQLDRTCPNQTIVPDTETCSDSVATCVDDGNGYTCKCPINYYDNNGNNDGGQCVEKVSLGAVCTNSSNTNVLSGEPCRDKHATCQQEGSTYRCRCTINYYDNNGNNINGGLCTQKKSLGERCPRTYTVLNTESCSDTNARCREIALNNYECLCMDGYYDDDGSSNTGGTCTLKVSLGDVCPNPTNTGVFFTVSCSDRHSLCQKDINTFRCRCTGDYYDSNGYSTDGGQCSPKVDLGSNCQIVDACKTENSQCVSGVCVCHVDYYDSNGYCIRKKLLSANCPRSNTESCSDTNAICKQGNVYKCMCKDGYYDNDGTSNIGGTCTLKVSLGAVCPNPTNTSVSSAESCNDTRATCQHYSSGSSYTCRCTSNYYDNGDTDNGECTSKVGLGYECPMADACLQSSSHCVAKICVCMGGHYDNNKDNNIGGQCKARKALGAQCTETSWYNYNSDQCKDPSATCNSSYICACNTGYHPKDGLCEAKNANGEDCDGTTADECFDSNTECRGLKCTCRLSYYDDNGLTHGGKCQQVSQLQVGSVVFSEIKTTAFTVFWAQPSGELSYYVDHYSVQWALKNTVNTENSPSLPSNTTTYVVNGVTSGRTYDVKIVSHNIQTENNIERNTSVITQQAAKPHMVGVITSYGNDLDVSDGNLKIVFTAASGGKSGYIVRLFDGTTKIAEKILGQYDTSTTIQNYHDVDSTHRSLKNGYRYKVEIVTKSETFNNNGNKVVQSDFFVKVIKTVAKKPGSPKSERCGKVTDSSITVLWSPPTTSNGDIVRYHIEVYLEYTLNSTRHTLGDETELIVVGLEPGTPYQFKLVTENEVDNSTATSYISNGCKTKAKMTEAPQNVQISNVESRSFTVTWDKPGKLYSVENFGYVLQIKDDKDVCVTEMLYKCSACNFGNFQFSQLAGMCTSITQTEQKTKDELDKTMTYNASLNPDIEYKVSVTAINGAGRGHEAIEKQKTQEEVPQKPTSVRITDISSTSFIVSWSIDGTRPGQTTFHVEVIADMPAISMTKSVSGFYNRNIEVTGLEEYWNYAVKVIASTSVGSMESDEKDARTKPSAPGKVSELTVTPHPGGIYTQIKISWKAPLLLDRNGVIKEYHFVHNTTKAATTLTSVRYSHHRDMEHIYETMLLVIPETYYYFKVIAVNTQHVPGQISEKIVMSPAGIPPNYIEKDEDVVKHVTDMRQNSFTVTLIRGFFSQREFGVIRTTGLIACKSENCNFKDSLSLPEFNTMPTWQKSASDGYPAYRITTQDWLDRRYLSDISFTIGSEDCSGVSDDVYCNGPLAPGSSYMIIAVACTNGGCLLSNSYGPFTTLEELKREGSSIDTKAIVIGVLIGLMMLLLIGYSGYKILKRRANLKQEQSITSPHANTQTTYVNQMFENTAVPCNSVEDNDNPEDVYTTLNDETLAEMSTYELVLIPPK